MRLFCFLNNYKSYIFFFHAFSIEFEISYLYQASAVNLIELSQYFTTYILITLQSLTDQWRKGKAVNQLIDQHKAQEERAIILREMTSMKKHISIEVSLLMGEYQCEGHICEC